MDAQSLDRSLVQVDLGEDFTLGAHPDDGAAVAGHEGLSVIPGVMGDPDRVDGALAERGHALVTERGAGPGEEVKRMVVGSAGDQCGRRVQRDGVHEDSAGLGYGSFGPLGFGARQPAQPHPPVVGNHDDVARSSAEASFRQALPPVPPISRRHLPVRRPTRARCRQKYRPGSPSRRASS